MKNFLFTCILILVSYLFIELCAFAAYSIKFGEYKLYDIQHSKLAAIRSQKTSGVYSSDDFGGKDVTAKSILHPYVGYTVDGKRKLEGCELVPVEKCYRRIRGYADRAMDKRGPNKLLIAILGGSFADAVGRIGNKRIVNKLAESKLFKDHEIIVHTLAAGGYKQPQQLTQLGFHYALGAEFDIVINLDGFNEMATPYTNYRDRGVHPAFPASWYYRVNSSMNQDFLNTYSAKRQTQKNHASIAKFCLVEGIRYSPLMNFIWHIIDNNFAKQLAAIDKQANTLSKPINREFSYEATGPDYDFVDWPSFSEYIGDIWVNSSLAMKAMAVGQGARYYQFLQPNQYIDGSKILSKWERKNAVLPSGSYGNVYNTNFKVTMNRLSQLQAKQVKIFDLTYLFKDISDTLYIDNCCHINNEGIIIVADKIVSSILEDLNEDPAFK